MALQSFPAFFLSLVAVYFLGLKLGWFPIQHAYSNDTNPGYTWGFVADGFRHAQLPVLVIIAISAGGWLLGMRNVMITTVQEDYVTMAHAKGLKDRKVMTGYAARNAILPPLTGFAAFFASAVGGLILVEVVFSYPGVGLTIQQAALGHDYPLVQALLLVFAFTVLLANFIMDCVYVILDPRVQVVLMGELSQRAPAGGVGPGRAAAPAAGAAGVDPAPARETGCPPSGSRSSPVIVAVTVLAPWLTSQSPSIPHSCRASRPRGPIPRHHRSGLQRVRPGDPRWAHLARRCGHSDADRDGDRDHAGAVRGATAAGIVDDGDQPRRRTSSSSSRPCRS